MRRAHMQLFLVTWLVGLPGVVVLAWLVLPTLVAKDALPVSLGVAQLASAAQGALVLALAAWSGAALSPKVNLAAPVLTAIVEAKPILATLRSQLAPGLVGGVVGAAIIWLFVRFAPDVLAQLQVKHSLPAIARLLYGGVTEEVLMRWGLMTFMVWLFWRIAQGGQGTPSAAIIAAAIVFSALAFGAGHLPAVAALAGTLPPAIAIYVVASNAAFGLVAGLLYWRFGLESAIFAHTLAHGFFLLISH